MHSKTTPPTLSDEQRIGLLRLARASLSRWLRAKERLAPEEESAFAQGDVCFSAYDCFVSLHVQRKLRGCVGALASARPLCQSISEMAVNAATRDSRFPPLKADELERCVIEISVLSEFVPLASMEEITIGKHGILIEGEGRRGLLLPQVAERQGWRPGEFLRQTYLKAGLPPREYPDQEAVFLFEAVVFSEENYPRLSRWR